MAASLLRLGRAGSLKSLQLESWSTLRRAPAALLCTKSGDPPKKPSKKTSIKKPKAKTYFDIEKLTQHRTYVEFPKKDAEVVAAAAAGTEAVVAATAVSSEELVDVAPVVAEAAGEELPAEAAPEAVESPEADLDPIQKLFLDKIREYAAKSKATGGLVDAGPEYQKNVSEEVTKLQRLYGGGDLTKFPEFTFTEPKLDEAAPK
ncbi:hypothetical protein AAFF_G00230720 [Aldrovandia affinis]|uniref:ATP synthase peripheral stalk subunit F6, mitochondrial n=1 Tax=Aldrovandia affinis TaxID=143900 RepID=A0AAD7W479_9TELE|nr:hypothetical protein AAFF_G00230720 [Aldrovandia affinis]